ncbi:DUF5694 domain-containing protein [Stenotrophomonas tumulicola]|uniref:TraB/GumN family protein n=1 Tax=Stenotrophomonas tumulicola TaxID=1685415 RepID=A0A7W3FJ89_9GAMM|nr:DUF5694 domain-containing protein [Stenotrophomonas tumulicola]MBA8680574.1 hypothetical protein [Stenotrophomonas tumulicola]
MKHRCNWWAWVALLAPLGAQAQVDVAALDEGMPGPRTEVMVLGSVHLSEHKEFRATTLEPLLDKLAAFKPTVITIEAVSGEQCDMLLRHPSVYGDDCKAPAQAQAATGLDMPAARAEADRLLATWPQAPSPAERRRLAATLLAAGERASAYVQWLQLDAAERHAGDGLDPALVQQLQDVGRRSDESIQIAARLAARLGLPRVHPVDDYTGGAHRVADLKAFADGVQQAWDKNKPRMQALIAREKALMAGDDLLPLYRMLNAPDTQAFMAASNVRTALQTPSAGHYPQIWVNGWEIRNLRMVANILETVRDRPGQRVLSVVGNSHKPWFDAWLGQASGVRVVDTLEVLE